MKISKALPCTAICLLAVLLFGGRPAHAQPGSPPATGNRAGAKDSGFFGDSHHYLWFTGHWSKTKKNVFIIDKGSGGLPAGGAAGGAAGGDGSEGDEGTGKGLASGGGTVTVNPDGTVNISGPGVDAWNKRVDAAKQQADDWVQQLSNPANNADPRAQHLSDLLLPDAQEQQQQWNDYSIDKKQDLLTPDTRPGDASPSKPAAPQRTLNDAANEMCTASKSDYDMVMAYYKSIRHAKDADLNVPPPPEFEYDCYVCDSDRRKVYDTTIAHYERDFVHPEDSMIRKALGMMRNFLLLNGNENTISNEVDQAFSKGGACYYMSYGELNEAMLTIIMHAYRRAEKLVDKYKNDFRACEAIARTFLGVARGFELVSGNTSSVDRYLEELAPILGRAFDFYYQKLRQNDWKQVANIPMLLGLSRQISLLGSNSGDYRFEYYFKKLKTIMNGFVLTVDMDSKFGRDQGYWLSHVKGQCHIGPDFQRDSNQCYKWVVLDEKRISPIDSMYQTKALQEIDCDLLANQMTGSQYVPVYVGTKKYTINLQGLRMDFCSPGQDTIILSRFYPNPKDSGWWRIPHAPLTNLGISGEQFFEDVKRQKELAESGQAQQAAANYQAQNEDMIAKMKAMAEQMKSDTGKRTFQDYQKIMDMANKVRQSANNGVLAKIMYLDFELPVENGKQILVDKKFDGKKINPEIAEAVIYAFFNIHIENKGNPAPPPKP
jgi:hypothetical protein